MTTMIYSADEVSSLRSQVKLCGVRITSNQAWDVLRTTNDLELAVTALVMEPRPAWVKHLIGR